MILDIILQTCTTASSQSGERYCGASKFEITKRCCYSLYKSILYAKKEIPELMITLTVLDDSFDNNSFKMIYSIFCPLSVKNVDFNIDKVSDENIQVGVMKSILSCYEYGKFVGSELVYFAQDDYLFEETAIKEMVEGYYYFRYMLGGREVGIYPYNDPYRYYIPGNIELCRVVHGPGRHWRTSFFTASCFMINHKVLVDNWDLFYGMGTCDKTDRKMEDKTINKLWQERGLILFTPIPSLALHMQFDSEKDPYIDWKKMWDENSFEFYD